jgi:hypothetical protein
VAEADVSTSEDILEEFGHHSCDECGTECIAVAAMIELLEKKVASHEALLRDCWPVIDAAGAGFLRARFPADLRGEARTPLQDTPTHSGRPLGDVPYAGEDDVT